MYKIYCDDILIYHQNIEELKVTSATVELEQNGIGTFDYTIYPTNPYINKIKDMQSIIKVYQDNYLLFKGLAVNSNIGYRNQKTVKCKQDYHFLTFSNQRTYDKSGTTPKELFTYFINEHNKQVDVKHQFKVGIVTVEDPNDYIVRSDSTYMNTWDSIKKKLIEPLGGYLRLRYVGNDTYIDYLKDFDTRNVQEITFGENMLDVKRESSGLDVATVLIPLGARLEGETTENGAEKRVDITSVNNGLDYVEDKESIAKYGRISITQTWDDVNEPSILLTKARKSLSDKIYKIIGIVITALDMAHVNKDISNFKMHNYIKVKSGFHGIDDYFLPLKMNINLFVPQNNKITLNTTKKSLTDIQIDVDNKYQDIIHDMENIKDNVKLSVDLTSNIGVFQVVDGVTYEPDYTQNNLVITPNVFISSSTVKLNDCTVDYKRVVNGVDSPLVAGESIVNNELVISQNTITNTMQYKCYVTYSQNGKTYKASDFISIVQVQNGKDGEDGKDGVAGSKGEDGRTSYFHVKYADVINPDASQMTDVPSKYIGTYVDFTKENSNDPLDYKWVQFIGDDGKNGTDGIMGENGEDGKTSFLHIKYSNDGGKTFTSNGGEDTGDYLGQYVDFIETDSASPSDYKWAKIKGSQGIQGQKGADGKQYYTWLKYADTPTSGMSDSPNGKSYIGLAYNKESVTESNNYADYQWSLIKGEKGDTGLTGGKGADGKTFYTWIKYATSSTGANMSDSPTGKTYIGIAYNKESATESTNASDYTWSLIKGDKGEAGKDGIGISAITNYYLATSSGSGVTTSTSGWTTTIQSISATKKYLWNYEKVTYTNGTNTTTEPCIIGTYGEKGQAGTSGTNGKDGVGISSIAEYYQVSTSNSTVPTTWLTTVPTLTPTNKYLWNYETITYTNGTTKDTLKRVIGVYGDKGQTGATGSTGNGISKTEVFYYLSTSNTAQSGGSWSTTVPAWVDGRYYWQKIKTTYTNGTSSESTPVCVTGGKGQTGSAGATGKGVSSITTEFYLSTSKTTQIDGSWVATMPTWEIGKYLWIRNKIVYSNPTSTVYTTPQCDSSWEAVNELENEMNNQFDGVNDNIQEVVSSFASEIEKTKDGIYTEVSEKYYTKNEAQQLVEEHATTLEQTNKMFEMKFKDFTTDIDNLQGETNVKFEAINKFIRFIDGKIILGVEGNELTLEQKNDRISFMQSGYEVAYFSNNKLYVTDGEFLGSLRIGKFAYIPRSNGSLDFKKVG